MPSGKKIATLCATAGLLATLPARAEELPPTTLPFHNVVTGEPLDLASSADTGRSTPAVKEFMQTGHNPYLTIPPNCYEQFESIFLTACSGCHGPSGSGIPAQYPRLAGQHADYTEAQLLAFRGGVRKNSAQMTGVAAGMTDGEIKAVSDYIAGLR